jgi:dienelactone hydrolase
MTGRPQQVRFPSDGLSCAATLYLPPRGAAPAAGLVMGNGFANVRQMYLPTYAEAFAGAGLAVLVIDYRFLGDSDGQPRQQVLPESQCDDLRNALSWLSEHPDVDPDRLALHGTSFAGGHVLRIASYDRRVKAVVAQVPAIGLWRYLRRTARPVREAFLASALTDRLDFARTGKTRMLAITGPENTESILGAAGYAWHYRNEQRHQSFQNAITAHSLDRIVSYDPAPSSRTSVPHRC